VNIKKLMVILSVPLVLIAQTACIGATEKPKLEADSLPLGETIEVNLDLAEYKFIPNHLEFELGKSYNLKIRNIGKVRHEIGAPVLAVSVLTLGVEVINKDGNTIVTFRGKPAGIELMPGQTVHWRFIPIKAQPKAKQMTCDEPKHLQHGMLGTFIIR